MFGLLKSNHKDKDWNAWSARLKELESDLCGAQANEKDLPREVEGREWYMNDAIRQGGILRGYRGDPYDAKNVIEFLEHRIGIWKQQLKTHAEAPEMLKHDQGILGRIRGETRAYEEVKKKLEEAPKVVAAAEKALKDHIAKRPTATRKEVDEMRKRLGDLRTYHSKLEAALANMEETDGDHATDAATQAWQEAQDKVDELEAIAMIEEISDADRKAAAQGLAKAKAALERDEQDKGRREAALRGTKKSLETVANEIEECRLAFLKLKSEVYMEELKEEEAALVAHCNEITHYVERLNAIREVIDEEEEEAEYGNGKKLGRCGIRINVTHIRSIPQTHLLYGDAPREKDYLGRSI